MLNTIQKFRQSSIVFEKPGVLSENLKTLTSSNYPTVPKFHTRFLLPLSKNGAWGLFHLDLEIFAKIQKYLVSTDSFFTL